MKQRLPSVGMLALATALALFVVPTTASPVLASPHQAVATISGQVTNSVLGLTLQVGAQASGPANSLSGRGFDSPIPGTPKGYCHFPLSGSVSGDVVTLSGVVTFSNDPANLGAPVTFTANASTGEITFNFGGFVFTGTGSVVIANQ